MTFDETVAHLGNPVLVRVPDRPLWDGREGRVVAVDCERQLVRVRLKTRQSPTTLTRHAPWLDPGCLEVTRWWLSRQVAGAGLPEATETAGG